MEQSDFTDTDNKNCENIEQESQQLVNLPPPPPPPQINLDSIKLSTTDEYIQKRLKNMQLFEGKQSDELSSKIQKIEDIDERAKADGEGTGEGLKEDIEGKIQCERCEHYFTQEEMKSHKIQHSSQILDFLYLGSSYNSNNYKELKVRTKISYILNVASELSNVYPEDFTYLKLDIDDIITQKIYGHFQECIDFIEKARSEGKNILVHCIQGISRSASVVIAYLMYKGMTLKESYDFVKERRSVIKPNPSFVRDLLAYELELYQKNSCTGEYINKLYKFLVFD
ncbi:tyrosine phosphatase (macronuclear) [Tetrahymena thermophila SB210]|uniref:Tyrosine phosphatase n=1 Tax=Tetrahymena thermophila (strain SB210) TaxID=312017 RepID=I7MJA2_TETTS|nr:tyrosine phosphatase [Tetrahymena thermophila SB210]EAS06094.2 tyrosine phosphatase [Tetrahymena thermophila SB210]|eukprot:XP_001026339.2 tyrosine phosphatase [Tetrahymena thermophila SB210]